MTFKCGGQKLDFLTKKMYAILPRPSVDEFSNDLGMQLLFFQDLTKQRLILLIAVYQFLLKSETKKNIRFPCLIEMLD